MEPIGARTQGPPGQPGRQRSGRWGLVLAAVLSLAPCAPCLQAARASPVRAPQASRTPDRLVIVVDPGHGWSEASRGYTGAYNRRAGVHEDPLALDMAFRVATVLQARGAEVYLTRSGDAEPPDYNGDGERTNRDRAFLALQLRQVHPQASKPRADAYVSIHLNASRKTRDRGVTVVYSEAGEAGPWTLESARLAVSVHAHMASLLPESAPPFSVSGLYLDRLALPHAVVEVAFLTNRQDLAWILEPENRQRAAERVAAGVLDWWGSWGRHIAPTTESSEVPFDVAHVPPVGLPPEEELFLHVQIPDGADDLRGDREAAIPAHRHLADVDGDVRAVLLANVGQRDGFEGWLQRHLQVVLEVPGLADHLQKLIR